MFIKILIVGDSGSESLNIENMLNEHSIVTAGNATEALKIVEESNDIDLILLDLNMTNMNGFDFLDIIRSKFKHKKIRTIILSSYDEIESEVKGLKLGAIDYIRQPIHLDSLKAKIEIHVELIKVQKSLEQKILEQGLAFDLIFKESPIGIAISYSDDAVTVWKDGYCSFNPMFEKITGRTIKQLINVGWEEISHPDDLNKELILTNKFKKGEIESYSIEKRILKPDGSLVWIDFIMSNIYISSNSPYNQIILIQDITQKKSFEDALIESERSKTVLLSHLPGLAYRCKYDTDWTMLYVSHGCFDLTGYPSDDLLYNRKLSFNDIISPEYRKLLNDEWINILKTHDSFIYEYEIMTACGDKKWVIEMGEGIFDDEGNVEALEGIIIDISYRKKMEDELKFNFDHDRWTGLYNRNYLERLIENDLKIKSPIKKALIGINLSVVNSLNKTYGFQYTQKLIMNIVDELSVLISEDIMLFNTYENRFVFYIYNFLDKEDLVDFCDTISDKLEQYLSLERIVAGIGIVEIDEDDSDVDFLFKKLLIASEKDIEPNYADAVGCFYDEDLDKEVMRELDIKKELARVAQIYIDGSLFLEYQPILDLKTNKIVGFEALARLKSHKLGLVSPTEFIPIAEETKLIIPIGDKILSLSLEFLNRLNNLGYEDMNLSINLSVIQLLDKNFFNKVIKIMNERGSIANNINLEITESIFSSDYEYLNSLLSNLKKIGVKISIDDFGTGYSSLSRERDLNVDYLKIDKSFIDKLMYLKDEEAITGDIISMAHKMGHLVIAEGVENEKQRKYLEENNCDKIQGYLISKPLDDDKAIEFLENYK